MTSTTATTRDIETERILKVTVFLHRAAYMTEADYHAYWSSHHAALAAQWLARTKVLKYTIYHTPSSERAKLRPYASAAGWRIEPHDGHVQIYVRSVEDLLEAVKDPFYKSHIAPDTANFVDETRMSITV